MMFVFPDHEETNAETEYTLHIFKSFIDATFVYLCTF